MTEVRPGARPDELVPGDPDEVERLAARLARFAVAAAAASAGLAGVDSGHWSGTAAEEFRAAVGPVPRQLARAGDAFAAAARALAAFADALREAQRAAATAVRLVEQSTPESAEADQQTARRQVEQARSEVAGAAQSAAARLAETAVDAPSQSGVRWSGLLPAVHTDGTTVRAVTEHELARPADYLAPLGDLVDSVHFGHDHHVAFAATTAESVASWQEWSEQGAGRGLGRVEPELLAALGIGAAGRTMAGRRRRDRTAFALVGLGEAEIRSRRPRRPRLRRREQGGVAAPAVSGRLRGAGAWRTRLASPPRAGGTVHPWAGPEASPLPQAHAADAVRLPAADRQASGVVQRTGPPADERRPGSGTGRPD